MDDNEKLLLASRIKAILDRSPKKIHIELLKYIIFDLDPAILIPGMKSCLNKDYSIVNSASCSMEILEAIHTWLLRKSQ